MASKRVALAGSPEVFEEFTASAVLTPGDLIEINSGQWRRHGTAAKNAVAAFALERDEMGDDIDVNYASGDNVKVGFFGKGMRVNAFIASGQNLSKGAFLESAGDGTLRALVTDAATDDTQRASVVAMSLEDSGAVNSKTRHRVVIV